MKDEQTVNYGIRRTEVPHRDPELAEQGFTEEKFYWNQSEHIVRYTRLDLFYDSGNIHDSSARICKN